MSNAAEVTDAIFESEVLQSPIPVLVDFWASWCNPCMMIAPLIDKVAAEYQGKLKVMKMDVDANSNRPSMLGIRSIPTLMIFKQGKLADQIIGVMAEDALKKFINKNI